MHAGQGREIEVAVAEVFRATVRNRNAEELSVGVECPTVIEASQSIRMPATLVDDLWSAMGTAVEQHVHAAVAMPRHDDRLPRQLGGEKVSRLGHLAGMTDKQP